MRDHNYMFCECNIVVDITEVGREASTDNRFNIHYNACKEVKLDWLMDENCDKI